MLYKVCVGLWCLFCRFFENYVGGLFRKLFSICFIIGCFASCVAVVVRIVFIWKFYPVELGFLDMEWGGLARDGLMFGRKVGC